VDNMLLVLRYLHHNIGTFFYVAIFSAVAYIFVNKFYNSYRQVKVILVNLFIFSVIFTAFLNEYFEYYIREKMKNNIAHILREGKYSIVIDGKTINDKKILEKFMKLKSIVYHHSRTKESHILNVITRKETINFKVSLDSEHNYESWVYSDYFNKDKKFEGIGIINSRELYKELDSMKSN